MLKKAFLLFPAFAAYTDCVAPFLIHNCVFFPASSFGGKTKGFKSNACEICLCNSFSKKKARNLHTIRTNQFFIDSPFSFLNWNNDKWRSLLTIVCWHYFCVSSFTFTMCRPALCACICAKFFFSLLHTFEFVFFSVILIMWTGFFTAAHFVYFFFFHFHLQTNDFVKMYVWYDTQREWNNPAFICLHGAKQ